MKKLMICGCSFSAPSHKPEYAGTAWGELLAKKLEWDVEILARQGCSNGGIRIQIDEVIRQKPTFAIISPTNHDRIEIPATALLNNSPRTKIYDFEQNWKKFEKLLQHKKIDYRGYDKSAGLDNINYGHNNDRARLICETLHSLSENWKHAYRNSKDIDNNTQNAVKEYISYMYDSEWKKQQDEWIIRDGLNQLKINNIPFLLLPGTLLWPDISNLRSSLSMILEEKYFLEDMEKTPMYAQDSYPFKGKEFDDWDSDPGYHTSPEGQEFLANSYYDLIKTRWNL